MANGATEPLTASERSALEEKLKLRRDELRAEIAGQLKNQDDPRLVGLRNRMEDTDDWAASRRVATASASTAAPIFRMHGCLLIPRPSAASLVRKSPKRSCAAAARPASATLPASSDRAIPFRPPAASRRVSRATRRTRCTRGASSAVSGSSDSRRENKRAAPRRLSP